MPGGRRPARARDDNPEDVARELEDRIGMAQLRFQAAPAPLQLAFVVAIHNLVAEGVGRAQRNPNTALDDVLLRLTPPQLERIQKALQSNNGQHKILTIAKQVWEAQMTQVNDARRLLEGVVAAMSDVTNLLLVRQFSDNDSGAIMWTVVGQRILGVANAQGIAQGHAAGAAAPRGLAP